MKVGSTIVMTIQIEGRTQHAVQSNAAALRLICLWIEHSINHPKRRLRLADVLVRENVEVVAACDLLREYDVEAQIRWLRKTDCGVASRRCSAA